MNQQQRNKLSEAISQANLAGGAATYEIVGKAVDEILAEALKPFAGVCIPGGFVPNQLPEKRDEQRIIVKRRWLQIYIYGREGWIRVFGRGFALVDHRIHQPLFSDRNGYLKRIHIGPWCLRYLSK